MEKERYSFRDEVSEVRGGVVCLLLACLVCILIAMVNYTTGQQIELSKNQVYGGVGFYPIVVCGIVFCILISYFFISIKQYIPLAYIGKHSYIIMALHFMVFKLVDYFLYLAGEVEKSNLALYPISNPSYRVLYTVLGILIPIIIDMIIGVIGNKLKRGKA